MQKFPELSAKAFYVYDRKFKKVIASSVILVMITKFNRKSISEERLPR